MKIAIMGTRGIPAHYGGFETFAEKLSERLAARGHEITVYGRLDRVGNKPLPERVKSVLLPSIKQKHLETLSNTILSTFHSITGAYDAVIICNVANSIVLPFYKLTGKPSLICVDGLEEKREKWGLAAKTWLMMSKMMAGKMADRIIADADVIRNYWENKVNVPVEMITYGVDENEEENVSQLNSLGLLPDEYFLYASRLEPENNAKLVIRAFEQLQTDKKLVVVGDAPYARNYIRSLKATKDSRIIFTGAIYGSGYRQLHKNCFAYIQATEVGGTHPALLEGLYWAPCVIAHDTEENKEVAGDSAIYFARRDADDLTAKMRQLIDDPENRKTLAEKARIRIKQQYQWDKVADQYERLIASMVEKTKKSL